MTDTVEQQQQSDDERRLAELGYSQALQRSWSSFSNFAISFTIISVLAGCFTTYGQAWNNGGPIAISWGWPIICGLILLVAMIGAIVLTHRSRGDVRGQKVARQVDRVPGEATRNMQPGVGEGEPERSPEPQQRRERQHPARCRVVVHLGSIRHGTWGR